MRTWWRVEVKEKTNKDLKKDTVYSTVGFCSRSISTSFGGTGEMITMFIAFAPIAVIQEGAVGNAKFSWRESQWSLS